MALTVNSNSDRTINRTINDDEILDYKTISENLQNEKLDTNRTVNEILQTLPEFITILYKEIQKKPQFFISRISQKHWLK